MVTAASSSDRLLSPIPDNAHLPTGLSDPVTGDAAVELLPQVLSWTAIVLLLFVSAGVVYLSAVAWRDRRRRKATEPRRRP
jgi:uncharacterized membrane protein